MLTIFTQFGAEQAEQSGLGALGVDGKAFVIQLITFVLAYLVLRRYAFGPILRILQERRDTIEQGVTLGEQMQKDKAALEATVADELHKARQEADKIIAQAHTTGRQAIQEAEDAARKKADSLIAQADDRIKQDTALARKRLEKDVAGLVSEATEAIIQEKVDVRKDAALIDKALKEAAS
jgi:F-type H+-transporting ATPase subunit b